MQKISDSPYFWVKQKIVENILFLDIETVSQYDRYESMPEKWQQLWTLKSRQYLGQDPNKSVSDWYEDKAAIFAEFGKIVCIGLAFFSQGELRSKAIYGDDEREILQEFFKVVSGYFNNPQQHAFCGHNVREFDIPYICRRAVICQLGLPDILKLSSKKPWEVRQIVDTMEMWKFGDAKNPTSLDLLAASLGLESSKDDIDGSMVGRVYWQEKDVERIAQYCLKDVKLTAQVYQRLM
ncbi:MAG TPA: ribonuclease H-like domain-containing protein [Saprospiraceae bacterium]|nr:ribonuclease H-like domain-containing protein [Saprospiraceae bacterium]